MLYFLKGTTPIIWTRGESPRRVTPNGSEEPSAPPFAKGGISISL